MKSFPIVQFKKVKMASTDQQQVVTNGNGVDSDDEDLSKMRPVDIDQDVREMERRKRVTIYNIL